MATPPNVRRIRTEDFDPEYRQLIERISFAINEFQDQTIFNLTKGIDFQNLNQDIIDVEVSIDGSGNLVNPPTIRTNLRTKARLVFVGNAVNLQNPQTVPTSAPFVTFTVDTTSQGQIVRLLGASGLQAGSQYRLSLLIIGENL
jgi:hypothetical protein